MFVSVLMIRAVLDECRRRGFEAEQLLEIADLTAEQLLHGGQRVPAADFERLAQRSLLLTGDPALGLSLGAQLPAQALQIVGYLLSSAPSMRHAYADFQRYAALLVEGPCWAMREEHDRAHFEFRCLVSHPHTQRMANDWAVSLAFRVIRGFSSAASAQRIAVSFSHPAPHVLDPYLALFGGAVRFGQKRNAVTFPRTWLDLGQPHGDRDMCEGLRELAERRLSTLENRRSLSDRLRLILNKESVLSQLGVAELARRSGLSESTLRRRLAAEGVSPSQLVDEARCRIACAELARRDGSVKQLANRLGYTELSSFHRAFKRWTGQTPAGYRSSLESNDTHAAPHT